MMSRTKNSYGDSKYISGFSIPKLVEDFANDIDGIRHFRQTSMVSYCRFVDYKGGGYSYKKLCSFNMDDISLFMQFKADPAYTLEIRFTTNRGGVIEVVVERRSLTGNNRAYDFVIEDANDIMKYDEVYFQKSLVIEELTHFPKETLNHILNIHREIYALCLLV